MDVRLIMKSARNAVIEIADGGIYNTKETYHILLNGEETFSTDTVINSLFDLKPQTKYEVLVKTADGVERGNVSFVTAFAVPEVFPAFPLPHPANMVANIADANITDKTFLFIFFTLLKLCMVSYGTFPVLFTVMLPVTFSFDG